MLTLKLNSHFVQNHSGNIYYPLDRPSDGFGPNTSFKFNLEHESQIINIIIFLFTYRKTNMI